jgi:hypothetical protein
MERREGESELRMERETIFRNCVYWNFVGTLLELHQHVLEQHCSLVLGTNDVTVCVLTFNEYNERPTGDNRVCVGCSHTRIHGVELEVGLSKHARPAIIKTAQSKSLPKECINSGGN